MYKLLKYLCAKEVCYLSLIEVFRTLRVWHLRQLSQAGGKVFGGMWCFLVVLFWYLMYGCGVCGGCCCVLCFFFFFPVFLLVLVCLFSICDLSNFSSQQTGPLLETPPDSSVFLQWFWAGGSGSRCSCAWGGELLTSTLLPTPQQLRVTGTVALRYHLYWGNLW